MSKHKLHDKTKINLNSLIRLAIFLVIIFFAISYLSSNTSDINVLSATSDISSQIPQVDISKFIPSDSPIYSNFQEKYQYLKDQLQDFPQKQIKEIQKELLKQTYQDILKTIENK